MKRSKINQIIEHADTMIREFGFTPPPLTPTQKNHLHS
ncbi:MAG: D-lyxose/D-mannose family sugar isomerase [Candidatus Halichondribacter symbioticus]